MRKQGIQEGARILDRLTQLYPEQPRWADLAFRLRDELSRRETTRIAPAPAAVRPSTPDQFCRCCRRRPADARTEMCPACAALYKPVTARVVADRCDCGHEPAGPRVYIYQGDEQRSVLCNLDCAARHWRSVFSFFIRRSACRT